MVVCGFWFRVRFDSTRTFNLHDYTNAYCYFVVHGQLDAWNQFVYLLDTSKGVDEFCVNMAIKFMWGELGHGLMILYFILCMIDVLYLIYGKCLLDS
jgi:hypothetical protein